jgi:hypothetical protein
MTEPINIFDILPKTGKILDDNRVPFNVANFLESMCSHGYETGASGGATNISTAISPTFQIAVDFDVAAGNYHPVTLVPTGLTSGVAIAAAMQTAIQALNANYAGVTAAYTGGEYVITSGTFGPDSKVRIVAGTSFDIAAALKIGAANGAVDTDGKVIGMPMQLSSNITAQAPGSAAPVEADMIGYKDGSGNSQMVSPTTPLPVQMSATPTIDLGVIQIGDGTTETQKLAIDANGKIGINALPGTPAQTADITTQTSSINTQLGTTGVKVTSLPGTPAQDGTDATGVSPPTGAVGIRGWLSSIYNLFAGGTAKVALSSSITAEGSLTNRSGTITAGGVAQTLAAANASRHYLLVQNPSNATESLWYNFTTAAVVGQPSIELMPGEGFVMETGFCSTEAVSVIAATTSHAYSAKEA